MGLAIRTKVEPRGDPLNDLDSIERRLNPFPIYAEMRQHQPVYYHRERFSWNVFCYDDVQRVLSEYDTFSSQYPHHHNASGDNPFAESIISTDPPRHRQLRALVTQAFTPRAVDALAPRIRAIVDEHLEAVMPAGQMDVIQDLGYPLPVIVIAELLGIPTQDRAQFKQWSDWIVQGTAGGSELNAEMMQSDPVREMSAYFMRMIESRRAHPGNDLISGLLQANIEGKHLSMIELLGFCSLLLVAGNETTTNLIGNALRVLTDHPDAWARLRAEPDLLPGAIEEVLRYHSPVQAMYRFAKVDTEVRGQQIPAGSPVIAWIGSANHDENQFPDPERFDAERSPNRHVAFGYGIHYYLGAPLARLEARIAIGAMLQRLSTVTRVPGSQLERLPSLIVYGLKSLPITFTSA
jgi:cytochrome P450